MYRVKSVPRIITYWPNNIELLTAGDGVSRRSDVTSNVSNQWAYVSLK
jgi:hypothetical protein